MKKNTNVILLVLMLLYCISPIDLAPGPIDDLIVIIIGYLAQNIGATKFLGKKNVIDV